MSDLLTKLEERGEKAKKKLRVLKAVRIVRYRKLLRELDGNEFLEVIDGEKSAVFFRGLIIGFLAALLVMIYL